MSACYVILAQSYLGAFYSSSQNSYMGAYRGVGACPGHYSIYIIEFLLIHREGN